MTEVIRQLLILQERDRQVQRLEAALAEIEPERRTVQAQMANSQTSLEAGRLKLKQVEAKRKELELEVEAQKQLIERYSLQQFQTKKNDEYRALAHEIDQCRARITTLEDQQLELMEQAESGQRDLTAIEQAAAEIKKSAEIQLTDLAAREANLRKQLEELQGGRGGLAAGVEDSHRRRYERLFKSKGGSVIVGIEHGVCGGCHVRLTTQTVVSCQSEEELMTCSNCGRILYYTPEMDLTVAD
ncbi:MAG: hypothetical protein KGS61_01885 [Verrucomicrobia bacterium]|nr:hypothetical protein [Verrucomicrobiota bacterium]